jgi:hypothetical protein
MNNRELPPITSLDWTPYGIKHPAPTESISDTKLDRKNDFGKICEISKKDLERQLPTWVVETNKFDDELAMASLRSALSVRHHTK